MPPKRKASDAPSKNAKTAKTESAEGAKAKPAGKSSAEVVVEACKS
jgi:hypothetical protein